MFVFVFEAEVNNRKPSQIFVFIIQCSTYNGSYIAFANAQDFLFIQFPKCMEKTDSRMGRHFGITHGQFLLWHGSNLCESAILPGTVTDTKLVGKNGGRG